MRLAHYTNLFSHLGLSCCLFFCAFGRFLALPAASSSYTPFTHTLRARIYIYVKRTQKQNRHFAAANNIIASTLTLYTEKLCPTPAWLLGKRKTKTGWQFWTDISRLTTLTALHPLLCVLYRVISGSSHHHHGSSFALFILFVYL